LLMTVSIAMMTVYTLQRLHNFMHRLVISSLAKRLKVFILPNVYFLWCTARRLIVFHSVFQPAKHSHYGFTAADATYYRGPLFYQA
jgi:hypothetical protein